MVDNGSCGMTVGGVWRRVRSPDLPPRLFRLSDDESNRRADQGRHRSRCPSALRSAHLLGGPGRMPPAQMSYPTRRTSQDCVRSSEMRQATRPPYLVLSRHVTPPVLIVNLIAAGHHIDHAPRAQEAICAPRAAPYTVRRPLGPLRTTSMWSPTGFVRWRRPRPERPGGRRRRRAGWERADRGRRCRRPSGRCR